MPSPEILKAKVCLVGEAHVGKTSLVRRFTENKYDDTYLPTLGAKVTKKELTVFVDGMEIRAVLTIWDVMGESSFREMLADAWFARSQGVLAVGDLTRPDTVPALQGWVATLQRVSGPVPILLLANKVDMPEASTDGGMADLARQLRLPWWRTSAKTGINVEAAFRSLAEAIARANLPRLRQATAEPVAALLSA